MRTSHCILSSLASGAIALSLLGGCANSNAETSVTAPNEFGFHMVRAESQSEAAMRLALEGRLPPGAIYRPFANETGGLILERRTALTADCVETAAAAKHPTHDYPIVNFTFNEACAKIFGEVTAESVGKQFAVILNGQILTAPRINSAITGGAGFIDSNLSLSEAQNMAKQINDMAQSKEAE